MIRLAMVGLGKIARVHTAAWEQMHEIELVAGVDVGDIDSWKFRGTSIPVYRTVEELVSHEPDYVVVATPTGTHYQVTLKILNTLDSKVLVEKPLASTIEHTKELLDPDRESGEIDRLVVLYHAAYAPEVQWAAGNLRRWLDEIGTVVSFDSFFSDALMEDFDSAARAYESSWLDSGINCLTVLARLVSLKEIIAFRRIAG
ncbi:MAG: Gfo/Idh/MocA family protein, partial [Pseudomonas fluorescens]